MSSHFSALVYGAGQWGAEGVPVVLTAKNCCRDLLCPSLLSVSESLLKSSDSRLRVLCGTGVKNRSSCRRSENCLMLHRPLKSVDKYTRSYLSS